MRYLKNHYTGIGIDHNHSGILQYSILVETL